MREFKPSSVGDDTFDVCGRCHSIGQRATMRHIWWCDDMEKLEAALLAERERSKRLETIAKIAAEMRTNTLRADGSIMWLNKAADLGAQMDAALAEAGEEGK